MNKFLQAVVDDRYRALSHDWYNSGMDQFQGPFELTNQWDISDNVNSYGNPAWMNAATDYVDSIAGQSTISPWVDTYQQDRIGTLNYVKNPEYNAFLGGRGNLQSSVPGYRDDSIAGYFKEAFSDPAQIKNRNDAIRNLRIWNENAGNGGVGLNKATDPMTKQYFDELRLNELYGLDGSRFNPPPPALPPVPQPAPIPQQTPIPEPTPVPEPQTATQEPDAMITQRPGYAGGFDPQSMVGQAPPRNSRRGFGGGIGNFFNQLSSMPEENFNRSIDRYQRFNDQYGSAMGPRNAINSMNMFNQFGGMDDAQFDMGMNRYQQYRDLFSPTARPDPQPLPPLSPGSPSDEVTIPTGLAPNRSQAPNPYFSGFGSGRNPYVTGYGMGYQPYQPPYMPQQGRLGYSQGPSKGSSGYMSSPAGQAGYGAFGGGQGYYSPAATAPTTSGIAKGGSSPSGKGGSA